MAAWRYDISLLVLKIYFTCSLRSLVKYFSTLEDRRAPVEEKFRISARPCNILSIYINQLCCIFTKNTTVAILFFFLLRCYPLFFIAMVSVFLTENTCS